MADVSENMSRSYIRRTRENSGVISCILLVSCCTYILYRQFKKRKKEVIVVSRYPEAGTAKTRMIPSLGEAGAAQLQVHMTEHIVKILKRYEAVDKDTDVTLQYNGGSDKQMKFWIERKTRGMACFYKLQRGKDLGEKLKHAISDSFRCGHQYVVVIGADIPGIDEEMVDTAFKTLQRPGTDMVLGKAEDGGYYLIGLHKSSKSYLDRLFDNIEWGTSKVFKQQMDQAINVGASPEVLPVVLEDVDTIDDIKVFEKEVGIPIDELKTKRWSIIIPVLNEERNISDVLTNIEQSCSDTNNIKEVIISDGGSTDNTNLIAKNISETYPIEIKVVNSLPGRGEQQIKGVDASTGDNFLFLHADARLPKNFDKLAANCLQTPGVVAGAFEFQLDVLTNEKLRSQENLWFLFQIYLLVWGSRRRSRKSDFKILPNAVYTSQDLGRIVYPAHAGKGDIKANPRDLYRYINSQKKDNQGIPPLKKRNGNDVAESELEQADEFNEFPYGDQGLFMSKRLYKEVGGFPPYPLMEDYILIEKLRTLGHIGIAKGDPIVISYRRWKKWGPMRITGFNQVIIVAYKFGIHPNTLAQWYYGKKTK